MPQPNNPDRRGARRAFTLIELLVVIGLIAVLAGIALVAGGRLLDGGRARLTQDAIKVLDSALSTYIADTGGLPPAFVRDPRAGDPNITGNFDDLAWPLADARDMTSGSVGERVMLNSVGFFIEHVKQNPSVEALLTGLPQELVRIESPSPDPNANRNQQPRMTTVVDAWGNPIRFVHPAWDGLWHGGGSQPRNTLENQATPLSLSQDPSPSGLVRVDSWPATRVLGSAPRGFAVDVRRLRRNNALTGNLPPDPNAGANAPYLIDSDGGLCTAGRPYFYSAGPSGNPGKADDNVYSTRPTIAQLEN